MTFLTSEIKEKLRVLDLKELDKVVQYIEKIKHTRKFSILDSHGAPLINLDHFSPRSRAKEKKKEEVAEDELPSKSKALNLFRKLSMPDSLKHTSEKEHEHVFSTQAEVEWYYIVDGKDIVYPEEYCDVLESLFRKPGHTGRHQKQTPFVDGDDTCLVDLHMMRHTNQRTGKVYPLRRKKNLKLKPKPKKLEEVSSNNSDSAGGASLPDDDGPSFFGSAFSAAFTAAKNVSSHPVTAKATDHATTGATVAAKTMGKMFTRTMTWFGTADDKEEEDEKADDTEPKVSGEASAIVTEPELTANNIEEEEVAGKDSVQIQRETEESVKEVADASEVPEKKVEEKSSEKKKVEQKKSEEKKLEEIEEEEKEEESGGGEEIKEEGGDEKTVEKQDFISTEIVNDVEVDVPEPRKRALGESKREPSTTILDNPNLDNPKPDLRSAPVENLD